MAREMACRKCKFVTIAKVCPICKATDMTPNWNGIIIVVDPENSKISKTMGFTQKGKYAINVT